MGAYKVDNLLMQRNIHRSTTHYKITKSLALSQNDDDYDPIGKEYCGVNDGDNDLFEEEESILTDFVHKTARASSTISATKSSATATAKTTGESKKIDQVEQLRQHLKQYRINQSKPIQKPAYTIFTNAALDGICELLPRTRDELLSVKGIGKKKSELYGDDILGIVRQHCFNSEMTPDLGIDPTILMSSRSGAKVEKVTTKPTPITLQSLTSEQRLAAEKALHPIDPSNVFISGAAGTGKSHVSKYIIQQMSHGDVTDDYGGFDNDNDDDDNDKTFEIMRTVPTKRKVAAVAPTGVAAINIGGSTLHSFFGIGLGLTSRNSISSITKKVRSNKEAIRRINETDVLLIDEVSMLSSDLLELLDVVARDIRKVDRPMGGMQIIAVGDFFQLPPIIQDKAASGVLNYGEDVDNYRPFCFDSPIWEELGLHENTIELSQVQRQKSGSKFNLFLNDMVRVGNVPWNILRDFNRKCLISEDHPLPDDGIVPTRIYTHNKDVDSENEARLAELDGELVLFKSIDEWREEMPNETLASIKKGMKVSVAAELPDEVGLKIGAQVMLTRNKDLDSGADRGLVNGSRGVVQDFHSFDNLPIVRFDNGRVERINRVEAVRYNPEGGVGVLIRKQLPLKLAWATTVHKSQGSTLTRAILDISNTFEAGQAYVSLSRLKDIQGLYLERPVTLENIQVSRRVLEYYRRVGSEKGNG
jgi:nucleoside-triphosphatase THEP1